MDDPRAPTPSPAIRITRPYTSEDDYLQGELETLTRTSITLLGAQQRPVGVVLRFELVLSSGQALVRGEGRVIGFKPNALHGLGGLTLRFTRLDSRSKALIDRAAALREMRRSSAPPAAGSEPPPAPQNTLPAPVPSPSSAALAAVVEPRRSAPPPRSSGTLPTPIATSADRDALLQRLRTRAKDLDASAVRGILDKRRQG